MSIAFDTLKAARRLQEEGGFDERQARGIVATFSEGMFDNLATKQDLNELRQELKAEIGSVRNEHHSFRAEMKASLENLEQRMTIKLGAMIIAAAGFITVLDKIL